jgi:hypothetical protein
MSLLWRPPVTVGVARRTTDFNNLTQCQSRIIFVIVVVCIEGRVSWKGSTNTEVSGNNA